MHISNVSYVFTYIASVISECFKSKLHMGCARGGGGGVHGLASRAAPGPMRPTAGALARKPDVAGALARLQRRHRPTLASRIGCLNASKSPLNTIKGDDYLIY